MGRGFGGEVAEFYGRYRRGYPPAVIDALVDAFGLGTDDVVLDLGCGTGQLTLPVAERVRAAVGMDPEPDMLTHARRACQEQGLANVCWLLGADTDLPALGALVGERRLGAVTIGQGTPTGSTWTICSVACTRRSRTSNYPRPTNGCSSPTRSARHSTRMTDSPSRSGSRSCSAQSPDRRLAFRSWHQPAAHGGEPGDLGLVVRPDPPAKRGFPEPRELRRMTTIQHDPHQAAHPPDATPTDHCVTHYKINCRCSASRGFPPGRRSRCPGRTMRRSG
jgi:SAM-dependent methyltransferase